MADTDDEEEAGAVVGSDEEAPPVALVDGYESDSSDDAIGESVPTDREVDAKAEGCKPPGSHILRKDDKEDPSSGTPEAMGRNGTPSGGISGDAQTGTSGTSGGLGASGSDTPQAANDSNQQVQTGDRPPSVGSEAQRPVAKALPRPPPPAAKAVGAVVAKAKSLAKVVAKAKPVPQPLLLTMPDDSWRVPIIRYHLERPQFDEAGAGWTRSLRDRKDPRLIEAERTNLKALLRRGAAYHDRWVWEEHCIAGPEAPWETRRVISQNLRSDYRFWVDFYWKRMGMQLLWEAGLEEAPKEEEARLATWELPASTPPEMLLPRWSEYQLASWLPHVSTLDQVADWAEPGEAALTAGGARVLWTHEGDNLHLDMKAVPRSQDGRINDAAVTLNRGGYPPPEEKQVIDTITETFTRRVEATQGLTPGVTWLTQASVNVILDYCRENKAWQSLSIHQKQEWVRTVPTDIRRLNGWYALWKIILFPHVFRGSDGRVLFPNFRKRCVDVAPGRPYAMAIYSRLGAPPRGAFRGLTGAVATGTAHGMEAQRSEARRDSRRVSMRSHDELRQQLAAQPSMTTACTGTVGLQQEEAATRGTVEATMQVMDQTGEGNSERGATSSVPANALVTVLSARQLAHEAGVPNEVGCCNEAGEELQRLKFQTLDTWKWANSVPTVWHLSLPVYDDPAGLLLYLEQSTTTDGPGGRLRLGSLKLRLPFHNCVAPLRWMELTGDLQGVAALGKRELLVAITQPRMTAQDYQRMEEWQRNNVGQPVSGSGTRRRMVTVEVLAGRELYFHNRRVSDLYVLLQQEDDTRVVPLYLQEKRYKDDADFWKAPEWQPWCIQSDMNEDLGLSLTVYGIGEEREGTEVHLLGWGWIEYNLDQEEIAGEDWEQLIGGTPAARAEPEVLIRLTVSVTNGAGRTSHSGVQSGNDTAMEVGRDGLAGSPSLQDEAAALRTAPVGADGYKEAGSQAGCGWTQASTWSEAQIARTYPKGLKLIRRMGYAVGEGLGATASGIVAPIAMQTRTQGSRIGLHGTPKAAIKFGKEEAGWGDDAIDAVKQATAKFGKEEAGWDN
eukprot:GHVU01044891.1.p1 GENE.GHVU01044891.1~~GHVU01044891.1.p1  ORF type:complete len:1227 (+),score=162.84 GHVU01044891.1:484-3681(+)